MHELGLLVGRYAMGRSDETDTLILKPESRIVARLYMFAPSGSVFGIAAQKFPRPLPQRAITRVLRRIAPIRHLPSAHRSTRTLAAGLKPNFGACARTASTM
jgi:hypothetical protein